MKDERYSTSKRRSDWPPPPPPPSPEFPRFKPRGKSQRAGRLGIHSRPGGHKYQPPPRREESRRERMPWDYEKPDHRDVFQNKAYRLPPTTTTTRVPSDKMPWEYEPSYRKQHDAPTVKGLFYMFLAGILFLISNLIPICGLLALIGIVIGAYGFYKIYEDRKSYPMPHPRNLEVAMWFYIIGWVIMFGILIYGFDTVYIFVEEMGDDSITYSDAFDHLLYRTFYLTIVSTVALFILSIGRFKILDELMPLNRKPLLYIAVIFAVLIGFTSILIVQDMIDDLGGVVEEKEQELFGDETDMDTSERNDKELKLLRDLQSEIAPYDWLNRGLTSIYYFLFTLCFYIAYEYQKDRHLRETEPAPGLLQQDRQQY